MNNKKNIYIVTDKYFSELPFELLITNGKPEKLLGELKLKGPNANYVKEFKPIFLAENYNISYHPSVSSFVELGETKKESILKSANFLGFGNPKFSDKSENIEVAKKLEKMNKILLNNRGYLNDSSIINERYAEIPFTKKELNEISLLFEKSKLYLGKNASETKIKNMNLKNYDVISFATHAEVSGTFEDFNEPFLVLTPPNKTSELNDGLLTSSEISKLKMNAKLVILSACNTASKEGKYAMGFSGLINSFFIAGTDSVIATHWPVEDKAGYLLISETIKKIINQRLPKNEALRETKLEFIAGKYGEEYKHPFYWAPYVLIGN